MKKAVHTMIPSEIINRVNIIILIVVDASLSRIAGSSVTTPIIKIAKEIIATKKLSTFERKIINSHTSSILFIRLFLLIVSSQY